MVISFSVYSRLLRAKIHIASIYTDAAAPWTSSQPSARASAPGTCLFPGTLPRARALDRFALCNKVSELISLKVSNLLHFELTQHLS